MIKQWFSFVATALMLSLFSAPAAAQTQSIPLRYSATTVQWVQLPFSVALVERAEDLGSDLYRIDIPGFLCVTTAPNASFQNWASDPTQRQQFQNWGEVEVQSVVTPMLQLMPGHMVGIAALPGNVPVNTTFRFRIETRHAMNKPNTGHFIESNFLRTF